jgi:positive regulator of sigma E activity
MPLKNSYFIIVVYILALISLFINEIFDSYFSKNVVCAFKIIGTITFLLILVEIIQRRFYKKGDTECD